MSQINNGRVVIGGLLAGVVINVGEFILNGIVIGDQMNAAMAAINKPPIDGRMIMLFVLFGFGLGFMLVWTYAAIRPRFGAGIKTAVCASTLVWGLAYLYPNLFMIIINLFPRDMMILATVWGLFEIIIAGVAGAWAYQEG